MKRFLFLVLVVTLLLPIVGCSDTKGPDEPPANSEPSTTPNTVPDAPAAPGEPDATPLDEPSDSTSPGGPTESLSDNVLMSANVHVSKVLSGTGDEIGEYAYVSISKDELKGITETDYKEFAETVVRDSGYNWVAIICDDGTGICFPGSMSYVAQYGTQDADGSIFEVYGNITVNETGGYTYETLS